LSENLFSLGQARPEQGRLFRPTAGSSRRGGLRGGDGINRKGDNEGGTPPQPAPNLDLPVMVMDDIPADREPHPGPYPGIAPGAGDERLEDLGDQVRGDPGVVIGGRIVKRLFRSWARPAAICPRSLIFCDQRRFFSRLTFSITSEIIILPRVPGRRLKNRPGADPL